MIQSYHNQQGFISLSLIILLSLGLSTSLYFLYDTNTNNTRTIDQLENTQRQLRQARRDIRDKDNSITKQQTSLASLQREHGHLKQQLHSANRALEKVKIEQQTSTHQLFEELEQTQQQLKSQQTHQASLAKKEQDFSQKITQLNEQSSQLEKQYLDAKSELSLERERAASYHQKVETLEQRLAREQEALLTLREQLEQLDQKNTELYSENSRLIQQYEDGTTIIRLENTILFPTGKTQLNRRGQATLDAVAQTLSEFPNHLISVEGHTDHSPIISALSEKYPSNWELSSARAAYAIRYLSEKGLAATRFQAVGFGSTRPIDTENPATNRRIEILLYPPTPSLTIKPLTPKITTQEQTLSFKE